MARGALERTIIDTYGNAVVGAEVTVYESGTQNLATLYNAQTGGSSVSNPSQSGARGLFQVYAENGEYDLSIVINGAAPFVITDVRVFDADSTVAEIEADRAEVAANTAQVAANAAQVAADRASTTASATLADNRATDAETAQAAAEASETAAAASEAAAAASETSAAASEAAAASSQTAAANSATAAATSETNAAASAAEASASESAAAASEAAAAASESAAEDAAGQAANGAGNFYSTFSEANSDIGSLSEGDVVRIFEDEKRYGDSTYRQLEGGELVFKRADVSAGNLVFDEFNMPESPEFSVLIPADSTLFDLAVNVSQNSISIDWGDGTVEPISGALTISHTYALAGSYDVTFTGDGVVSIIRFEEMGNLVSQVKSIGRAAGSLVNFLVNSSTSAPTLPNNRAFMRGVNNLNLSFRNSVFNGPCGEWDVSSVTNFSSLFLDNEVFDQDISGWDTSRVESFSAAFRNAILFNQPLNEWDVSQGTAFNQMFAGADAFNQPLNYWNVSSGLSFSGMFFGADSFNQPLNDWNVSNATDMSSMFATTPFNQPLDNWDVSKVETFLQTFLRSDFDQDISAWDVGSCSNFVGMFRETPFNQPIGVWDMSSAANISEMFRGATLFDQDISAWDIAGVTDAANFMFGATLSTVNYDALLVGWESQAVQDNVTIHFGNSQYTLGSAAETARTALINDHGWIITDGGGV